MIIVLDSNIWLSELGLRSPLGAVTRLYIRQHSARIGLPEVVRLEVERNYRNRLKEFISRIRENHRQLLAAFGSLKEVVLPDDAAVDDKIASVFGRLDVEVLEFPLSLSSARSSFLRTIDKTPPSDRTQEFKDGVLWADCVLLLQTDDVYLVTADKAFYQDRDCTRGLAKNLEDEVFTAPHKLRLLPSLSELVAGLRTHVAIDEELLASTFLAQNKASIDGMLSRNGFELGARTKVERVLYATENPGMLFIEFTIEYEAEDISGDGRMDGILTLRGDGLFDTAAASFKDLRNFGEALQFQPSGGGEREVRNLVIFAGSMTMGHREVTHTVRYKLD
jgi:hypothetical protein